MSLEIVVFLVVIVILSGIIVFEKVTKNTSADTNFDIAKEKIKFEERNKYLEQENTKSTQKIEEQEKKITDLTNENKTLNEKLIEASTRVKQLEGQIQLEKDILDIAKKEFSNIALETLSKEQESILEKNQTAVKTTLEPLNEKLKDFKDEITKYQKDHTENTGKLTEQLKSLQEKSSALSESAQNLTDALTQNRNVKGWYGEDLAKIILEKSGLQEGVHFVAQVQEHTQTQDSENKLVRPDYEIFLPDNRNLVIDAKAILSSITEVNSDDEEAVKKVFSAVKTRADELKKKKYENIRGLNQPEFVIMYIPIEPIVNLLYTTKEGMDIVSTSRQNNIVITGSVSLVTIINLIEKLWKENDRIKNIDKIVETGEKLYESVAKHAEEMIEIQKCINNAKEKTDDTIKRLIRDSNSKLNIFKEAEKLKDYGISSSKQIPQQLTEESS